MHPFPVESNIVKVKSLTLSEIDDRRHARQTVIYIGIIFILTIIGTIIMGGS